ncbi:MAG: FGGY-family carbohydrate kinase, partial [Anaerolineae bacterium]|nr:FGGY-family carbohydrate kinase [Anaerolineae bacterium]
QHALWLQLQADVYGRPVRRTRTREAAATGAAMLAGVGVGIYPSVEAAVAKVVRWHDETVMPEPARVAVYNDVYSLYKELYPTLCQTFRALSDAVTRGSL